ncbi:unnamed protein product [Polarella glacialis]|uniref:Uncharacterized protein n=1 Tax=Polarella glacialis TaxID=89957 RepID=A0A813EDV7_POLGL|nr:unnamed protein product [Polarella glacialis]
MPGAIWVPHVARVLESKRTIYGVVSASKLPDGYHLLVQQKRPKGTQDSWSGGGNSWGGDGQQQLSLLGPSGDGSLSSQIAAHAPQNMGAPPHMQPGSGGGGW